MEADIDNMMDDMGMDVPDFMQLMQQQQTQPQPAVDNVSPELAPTSVPVHVLASAQGQNGHDHGHDHEERMTAPPDMLAQSTINIDDNVDEEDGLTGQPLVHQRGRSQTTVVHEPLPDGISAGPTINIGGLGKKKPKTRDDDDEPENSVKIDISASQPSQDEPLSQQPQAQAVDLAASALEHTVSTAFKRLAKKSDANKLNKEQHYRMTRDPDNPGNIFVFGFGENEEQHWKVQWSGKTTLMCHMPPNELLTQQTNYNHLHARGSLTPWMLKKGLLKKYRAQKVQEEQKQQEEQDAMDDNSSSRATHSVSAATTPTSPNGGNGLFAPASLSANSLGVPMGAGSSKMGRGTFNASPSFVVHSEDSVEHASLTDGQMLEQHVQHLQHQDELQVRPPVAMVPVGINTDSTAANTSTLSVGGPNPDQNQHMPAATPLTSQIDPTLLKMAMQQKLQQQPQQQQPKRNSFGRRMSLDSVIEGDDESMSQSSSDSEDDDDDAGGGGHRRKASSKISVSLDTGAVDADADGERRNLSTDLDKFRYASAKEDGKEFSFESEHNGPALPAFEGFVSSAPSMDGRQQQQQEQHPQPEWKAPKITHEQWGAIRAIDNMFIGDEFDALNFLEIMENRVRYFVNCSAGSGAYELQSKLESEWVRWFKRSRQEQRERDKQQRSVERQKRRKQRIQRARREYPNRKYRKWSTAVDDDDADEKEEEQKNKNDDDNQKKYLRHKVPKNSASKLEFENFCKDESKIFDEIKALQQQLLDLQNADSDHSSICDDCYSSDEYIYESEEEYDDEYAGMTDDEIIRLLCPFKFLNIYAHDWEGYDILGHHLNDFWDFMEQWRFETDQATQITEKERHCFAFHKFSKLENESAPERVRCLVFCSKNNVQLSRLKERYRAEMAMHAGGGDGDGAVVDREKLGRLLCDLRNQSKTEQSAKEGQAWQNQRDIYNKYISSCAFAEEDRAERAKLKGKKLSKHNSEDLYRIRAKHKRQILRQHAERVHESGWRYHYKWWHVPPEQFWQDFDSLQTRDNPITRRFQSRDRSATLVIAFLLIIVKNRRFESRYKYLTKSQPNLLRNQSFLRQLIQLDWMKRTFDDVQNKDKIPQAFRDEYIHDKKLRRAMNEHFEVRKKYGL